MGAQEQFAGSDKVEPGQGASARLQAVRTEGHGGRGRRCPARGQAGPARCHPGPSGHGPARPQPRSGDEPGRVAVRTELSLTRSPALGS